MVVWKGDRATHISVKFLRTPRAIHWATFYGKGPLPWGVGAPTGGQGEAIFGGLRSQKNFIFIFQV